MKKRRAPGLNWGRWIDFGRKLEQWRGRTSLTQAQAAAIVGISRRQWIRYTKGAAVPIERIPAIAKALNVPVGKVLSQAGHKTEELCWDIDAFSRAICDSVLEGKMSRALLVLYDFYQETHEEVRRYRHRPEVVLLRDFVFSVIAINEMPDWLRRELIVYLLSLEYGGNKKDFPVAPAIRKKVRAMISSELRKPIPSVKGLPIPDYRTM